MSKQGPVAPQKVYEQKQMYAAVYAPDTDDRFLIEAETEALAKALLIDKLGYEITVTDTGLFLCDVETNEPVAHLKSTTMEAALDEVLRAAQWELKDDGIYLDDRNLKPSDEE